MKTLLHGFGKFYNRVVLNFIGIFIFVGVLSIVFGDCGWMPDENIYAISQFVYRFVIPVLIAYVAGNQVKCFHGEERPDGRYEGGAVSVMAVSGILLAVPENGIFGAMILGPFCGFLWKNLLEPMLKKLNTELEMLLRNLLMAVTGGVMAVFSFYLAAPVLSGGIGILLRGMDFLLEHNLLFLLSILIEPLKVFFLNNSIHYGILLPLGMQQAELTGGSVLFLLESNPGPGFGVLTALYLFEKRKRKECAACMFAEAIGGIHEVYFPKVLSNLWLMIALIFGGTAGNLWFSLTRTAPAGIISPGSILSILLVCEKEQVGFAFLGVLLSAFVAASVAVFILYVQQKYHKRQMQDVSEKETKKFCGPQMKEENQVEEKQMGEKQIKERQIAEHCAFQKADESIGKRTAGKQRAEEVENRMQQKEKVTMENGTTVIRKIGFVCDAGVGSSAMGAALFRRKLKELGITGIEVSAYAVDQIPEDLEMIVCQKDFKEMLSSEGNSDNLYVVESLLEQSEYDGIIERL